MLLLVLPWPHDAGDIAATQDMSIHTTDILNS
jgi:hypothetical protein